MRPSVVRIGVIGLGHFAQVAILPAFRALDGVRLAALVSGSHHKRDVLSGEYDVPISIDYDDLDALLDHGELDAVYIATPPDLHADFTIRCARRGVHVLCEKPMAPTERECTAMIDACEDAGVQLMIAYRLHFEAANLAAIDLATDGRLGEPRYFTSSFSLQVRDGNIRVQDRPGAGPHWDLGVYCINAARYLFRAEPYEVSAMALRHFRDERFRAVPEQVAALLRFPGDRVANFVCSFGAHDRAHYTLGCTDGIVTLDNAYEYHGEMEMTVLRGDGHRSKTFSRKDQIAAEIDYFCQCVRDGRTPEPSGYEGLADVRVVRAIERSIESGRSEGVEPVERVRRPEPRQELWIRPHGKPRTVDVESGSR